MEGISQKVLAIIARVQFIVSIFSKRLVTKSSVLQMKRRFVFIHDDVHLDTTLMRKERAFEILYYCYSRHISRETPPYNEATPDENGL